MPQVCCRRSRVLGDVSTLALASWAFCTRSCNEICHCQLSFVHRLQAQLRKTCVIHTGFSSRHQ